MSLQKALEFFEKNPGHLKTSSARIALRLNTSLDDVIEARRIYRQRLRDKVSLKGDFTIIEEKEDWTNKSKEEGVETQYKKFLERNGIKEEDVVNVYYKEKSDGIRFTVQTKNRSNNDLDKEELYKFLSQYEYKGSTPNKHVTYDDTVAVLNIFDAHIDKLSYLGKGGAEEMKDNIEVLYEAFKTLFADILLHSPKTIIFPIGNDFFNTNGSQQATKAGTPQHMTVSWQDSFQAGVEFYRTCIDIMSEYTNVHVVNIPGNHDTDKVYYLGEVIKAIYEKDDRVTLDMSKDPRKYVYKSGVLFGFGHGKVEKRKIKDLPSTMAIEEPQLWAVSKHKVWILGDIHHSEEYSMLNKLEHNGVDIKFLRSASAEDEWHHEQMWISAKKSLSYMIYKDNGNRIITDELFIR